jgi:hypothetical protein
MCVIRECYAPREEALLSTPRETARVNHELDDHQAGVCGEKDPNQAADPTPSRAMPTAAHEVWEGASGFCSIPPARGLDSLPLGARRELLGEVSEHAVAEPRLGAERLEQPFDEPRRFGHDVAGLISAPSPDHADAATRCAC